VIALLQVVLGVDDRDRQPPAGHTRQNAGDGQVGLNHVEAFAPLQRQQACERERQARRRRPAGGRGARVAGRRRRAAQAMDGDAAALEIPREERLPREQIGDLVFECGSIEKRERVHEEALGAAQTEPFDDDEHLGARPGRAGRGHRPSTF
jgi:hypothetical protein